jgi:hypothetical protein
MKRIFLAGIFSVLTLISITSCNDFLEYTQYGSLSTDQFWKTESDLKSAVDGLYFWGSYEGVTGRGFMWYDNASDNMITGRDKSGAAILKNFTETGNTDRDVVDNWPKMCQLIRRANNILLYAPSMNVDSSVKNEALGEAYFFRAFAYLWLAPWYGDDVSGGIPIYVATTPVDSLDMPRPSSVMKNYTMIINDLKKAADLLPYFENMSSSNYGRPHVTACWGLIARAALYAAQFDASYYQVVSDYCDKIISHGKNNLYGYLGTGKISPLSAYSGLFTPEQNWGVEYLWSLPSSLTSGSEFPGVLFQNGGWGLFNTWGYFQPTLELYNEYEQGDNRRDVTIVYPGNTISFVGTQNIVYAVNPAGVSSPSYLAAGKYLAPFAGSDCVGKTVSTNGDYPTTTLNPPVLRYADVLLMKAEAMIKLSGTGTGDQWINIVRNRAGLNSITGATMADLQHERRCELAFEFGPFRYLDLVRWGLAGSLCQPALHGLYRYSNNKFADWRVKSNSSKSGYSINADSAKIVWPARTWSSRNKIFAIPTSVISSSKVLTQNNGF